VIALFGSTHSVAVVTTLARATLGPSTVAGIIHALSTSSPARGAIAVVLSHAAASIALVAATVVIASLQRSEECSVACYFAE
jgi:hypothetical protein